MLVSPSRNLFLINSSLMEEAAAALDSGGIRQPAGGRPAAVHGNGISSDSIDRAKSPQSPPDNP